MIVIIIKALMVKRSRQKELILRVLQRNPSHPPAVWIYDEVRKEMPHVSLATVYRNLRLFREQGEISELKLDGSLSRFELRTDNHGHVWCQKCDRIFDVVEQTDRDFKSRVAQETGFELSDYRPVLRGICQECRLIPARKE